MSDEFEEEITPSELESAKLIFNAKGEYQWHITVKNKQLTSDDIKRLQSLDDMLKALYPREVKYK